MGNTSCDVDSAIGALVLAYYLTKKSDGQETWVPVINAPKKDFFCNLEIIQHLKDCGITQEELYYWDEFKGQFPSPDDVEEVALIDHNILDVDQADLGPKVTRVIDHHVDSGAYKDQLKEKICYLIGSACSLLALKVRDDEALFADDLKPSEDGSANLAYLLAAAIVLDTYWFKEDLKDKKWTDQDSEAHTFLAQFANIGKEYWQALNTAKFDVQAGLSLGLHGIFIRDYKNYNLEGGIMGVAVSTGSIDILLNHFGIETFAKTAAQLCVDRNLGLFVVISINADSEGNVDKGITIFKPSENQNDLTHRYDGLLNLIEGWEDMQLSNKREFSSDDL